MYYSRMGEYYVLECPLCGASFKVPDGPLKQTAPGVATPTVDIRCPSCKQVCLKPGDALQYRQSADEAGQRDCGAGQPAAAGAGAGYNSQEQEFFHREALSALQAVSRQLTDLTNLSADMNDKLADMNADLKQASYDIDATRKWVKFFGVLVVLALIIALLPVIAVLLGGTCALTDYLK